jgi:hypothetical protein
MALIYLECSLFGREGDDIAMADRKKMALVKHGYEAMTIIEDLLLDEQDENKIEKLRLLRRDVSKIVNINKQINAKEQKKLSKSTVLQNRK